MHKRSIRDTPEDAALVERPDMNGMHVWWLVSREASAAENVVLNVAEFAPGVAHQLHRHPNAEEITFVLEGTGVHLFEGGEVTQTVGEAIFIDKGEWHGLRNDGDTPLVIVGIYGGVANLSEAGYEEYPDGSS